MSRSSSVLIALALCIVVAASAQFSPYQPYSAVYNSQTDSWSVVGGRTGVVTATIDDGIWTNGWYTLNLETNPTSDDYEQAYGSGFLEAALTYDAMYNSFMNWCNSTSYEWPAPAVKNFALTQEKWIRMQIAQPPAGEEAYWAHVGLVYAQWDGMVAGYNMYAPAAKLLPYDQWLAYQLEDEIGDISASLNLTDVEDITNPTATHCSSLVKVSADGQRLFAAQDTWSSFNSMLRVYKHTDHHFNTVPGLKASGASYSSYPGAMPSIDDYYVTSANLVVMETTNGVMNQSLYVEYTTTETVPYWVRVMVANRMSSSGEEWMNNMARYNSGTYNNQWIIVDQKRFTPGQPLQPGTLWVGEQIPGYLIRQDMTPTLVDTGYWASYNIPYFPFVYNISGYIPFFEKYGNTYSHDHCARANIFRRDEGAVQTLDDMKRIMRYNQWQTDPLSEQDSCRGISARCDMNPPWANNPLNSYSPFGAIDSKITSNSLSSSRSSIVVAGPSWESQPVFAWTNQWVGQPHYGHPDVFNFKWMSQTPQEP